MRLRQIKILLKHYFNLRFSNNIEKTGYRKHTSILFRMQAEFRAFFRPFLKRMRNYRGRPVSVISDKLRILFLPLSFLFYSFLFLLSSSFFFVKYAVVFVCHYLFRFWKASLELGFLWGDFLYTLTLIVRYFLLFIIKKPLGFFTSTSCPNYM